MAALLLFVVAMAGTCSAWGQITSLGTDHTGSVVLFSSAATLKGLDYGDDERVYELKPGGQPGLLAELPFRATERGLMWPALSGDGRIRVWTDEDQCTCCSSCWLRQRYFARMLDPEGAVRSLGQGQATVSPDGRWVSWGGGTGFAFEDLGWLDLRTGETIRRPFRVALPVPPGAVGVSNDGGRVLPSEDGRGIRVAWPDGRLVSINGEIRPWRASIDPESRYALIEESSHERIWIADLINLRLSVLVEAAEGVEQPQTSQHGRVAGFISAANWTGANGGLRPQFWLIEPETGFLRQVTSETTGVRTAALSGDGRVVYVVNELGELVRVTAEGVRSVVLGAMAWPDLPAARTILVPGTRGLMTGTNLAEARVQISGVEARVVARDAGKIEFVVPAVGEEVGQIAVASGPEGPFEPRRLWGSVKPMYVSFWTWADHWPATPYPESLFAWAEHAATRRMATPAEPLTPGEWFEVQATGVRLEDVHRLSWFWNKPGAGPELLEAGPARLDPNMEGLLRIALKAPALEPGNPFLILPRTAESDYVGVGSPVPAAGQ